MQYFIDVMTKRYAQFTGRARRAEYWYFFLFNILVGVVLGVIAGVIKVPLLANVVSLAFFIPSIAVGVRRMHDVGKSGWFFLIPIYNLILCCTEGQHGDNEYGPDPKGGVVVQF